MRRGSGGDRAFPTVGIRVGIGVGIGPSCVGIAAGTGMGTVRGSARGLGLIPAGTGVGIEMSPTRRPSASLSRRCGHLAAVGPLIETVRFRPGEGSAARFWVVVSRDLHRADLGSLSVAAVCELHSEVHAEHGEGWGLNATRARARTRGSMLARRGVGVTLGENFSVGNTVTEPGYGSSTALARAARRHPADRRLGHAGTAPGDLHACPHGDSAEPHSPRPPAADPHPDPRPVPHRHGVQSPSDPHAIPAGIPGQSPP